MVPMTLLTSRTCRVLCDDISMDLRPYIGSNVGMKQWWKLFTEHRSEDRRRRSSPDPMHPPNQQSPVFQSFVWNEKGALLLEDASEGSLLSTPQPNWLEVFSSLTSSIHLLPGIRSVAPRSSATTDYSRSTPETCNLRWTGFQCIGQVVIRAPCITFRWIMFGQWISREKHGGTTLLSHLRQIDGIRVCRARRLCVWCESLRITIENHTDHSVSCRNIDLNRSRRWIGVGWVARITLFPRKIFPYRQMTILPLSSFLSITVSINWKSSSEQ